MSIFSICAAAVITAVFALMLRQQSPHSAMLLSAASGVMILLSLIGDVPQSLGAVRMMLEESGIASDDILVLFKAMGICFVTEFTCDCVTEAGLLSLSTNISFAGKIIVLLTSLPLFDRIISVIRTLGG